MPRDDPHGAGGPRQRLSPTHNRKHGKRAHSRDHDGQGEMLRSALGAPTAATPAARNGHTRSARAAAPSRATQSDGNARYINRELSWLDFCARVLTLAEQVDQPLLERAKFLAIMSEGLDEFFQVRVAGLKEQVAAGVGGTTPPDGMSAPAQLRAIRERAEPLVRRQTEVFTQQVRPALEKAGIRIVATDQLSRDDKEWVRRLFEEQILPVLTPLAVDPAHPFPYISNLSLSLAVLVRDPQRRAATRFARIKVPPLLPRFVGMPDGMRFVPLEQVIAAHLPALFPGMRIVGCAPFRLTRNADLELEEDEADDLLAAIETELRRRRRFADVVRLEVVAGMSDEVLQLLMRELELEPGDVYVVDGLLDLSGLWALHGLDRPDLKDEPWMGVTPLRLSMGMGVDHHDVFRALKDGDVLVHHPYESFATTVEAFIDQAARDPHVLAIKQTLYRTSGPEGGIMLSLIRAAEAGKQVVALVELKARGDEQANIAWAKALEQAGVHVVYGMVGLKTHAKIALVIREEGGSIRPYVHIGTGNYNPRTATVYEDVGILSAAHDLGADLTELFNHLTGYSRQREWRRLLVAPESLRPGILELIRREAASRDGRIVMKMNSLVDQAVIDALYAASSEGAEIDLIIRGICCLRPGVPGQSERIRVRSLVGRYLEHSRIYRFGSDARGPAWLIGSADMMPRNLDRRVEALVPVTDPSLQARLAEVHDVCLADDVLAWQLESSGSWHPVRGGRHVNAQRRLQELALERAQHTLATDA